MALTIQTGLTGVGRAADAFETATEAYEHARYNAAETHFRRIAELPGDPQRRASALFNRGQCLQQQGRYREAIRVFRQFFTSKVDRDAPGDHLMEAYSNERPRALWAIAHCERLQGKYARALQTYRDVRLKYPFQSWCGNCSSSYEYSYAFHEGLCLEGMGRTADAARTYWSAVARGKMFGGGIAADLRLVELYDAAGQLDDIAQILDAADTLTREEIARGRPADSAPTDDVTMADYLVTSFAREALALHRLAAAGDYAALVRAFDSPEIRLSITDPDRAWTHLLAARLLARTPEVSTRALLDSPAGRGEGDDYWVSYALGLCGTSEAAAWLRRHAEANPNLEFPCSNAVVALSFASENGARVLQDLGRAWGIDLAEHLREDRELVRFQQMATAFPPFRREAKLPTTLADLRWTIDR